MLVTIFADASHDATHKVAGWGAYLVSERGKHTCGGAFRGTVVNSSVAEAMAVVNAIHVALVQGVAQPGDHLLVQSDCKFALSLLGETDTEHTDRVAATSETNKAPMSAARQAYHQIIQRTGCTATLRWVRGHEEGVTTRSYANEVCDQIAKEHMRRRRKNRKVSLRRKAAKNCNQLQQIC